MPEQAKRVLVTGAGGFIGRWSIPPLLSAGFEVHAVLSQHTGRAVPEPLHGASIHVADLLEASAIDALLDTVSPTHLLHFAWIAIPGVYWQSAANFNWTSAGEQLMRGFHRMGGSRAVMAGTCAEYDWSRAGLCDEILTPLADSANCEPSPYAACKIRLQRTLGAFGEEAGLSTAWGRVFFQFGPYEHPDRLVPTVIRNLLLGREALCSPATQVRSFLHVADVGAAFAALLQSEVQGPVNIGSGHRVALSDLIHVIAAQIGRPDLVRLGARPAAPHEPALLVPLVHRLRDEVGWQPRWSLDEAIAHTIAWWRRQPPQGAAGLAS